MGFHDALIGLRVVFKDKARRLRGRHGFFQLFHALQLIDARKCALSRRGAHEIAVDIVLKLGDLFLLLFVFTPLLLQKLFFQHFILAVIAFEGEHLSAFQLQRARSEAVEEVTVVGDDEHRPAIGREIIFEPEERLDVEVVGRLVEDEKLGFLQKQTAKF